MKREGNNVGKEDDNGAKLLFFIKVKFSLLFKVQPSGSRGKKEAGKKRVGSIICGLQKI